MKDIPVTEAPEDTNEYPELLGDVDWRSKGAVNGVKN